MAEAQIYALCCPDSGEVRYIGKANDAAARLKSHMRDSVRRDTPVYRWIRKLAAADKRPAMRVLIDSANWQSDEVRLIAEHRAAGARLLNVAEGGTEPYCSTETRATNGRKNAAAVHGDPLRRRLWMLKKSTGETLRYFLKRGDEARAELMRTRMRALAAKYPAICGEWAGI